MYYLLFIVYIVYSISIFILNNYEKFNISYWYNTIHINTYYIHYNFSHSMLYVFGYMYLNNILTF